MNAKTNKNATYVDDALDPQAALAEVMGDINPLDATNEQIDDDAAFDPFDGDPLTYEELSEESTTDLVPTQIAQISIPEDATPAERLIFMAFLGDTKPLWDEVGNTLTFTGVIHHDDYARGEDGLYKLDEDGALIPCKRCVFRREDGSLYATSSPVAYGWVKNKLLPVMTINGRSGLFVAPVQIKIGQRRTKSGRMTFRFDIILSQ
jgi:hypothetical protein